MKTKSLKIVFSPNYDIQFFGVEKLHPFDSCKYGRAWKELIRMYGREVGSFLISPQRPASRSEICSVHTRVYIGKLSNSRYVARALEIPPLAILPGAVLDKFVLLPMRWATRGTIIAAQEALRSGMAVNLSGGYHHASSEMGEGFCLYSDIAIAITLLRSQNIIKEDHDILIIDLDAHQGNGLERIFCQDKNVLFFDMYNQDIYPNDRKAQERIDFNIPLSLGTSDKEYLSLLKSRFNDFLSASGNPVIAFYNAGTDVYAEDPLGGLNVSADGILERDKFVFEELTKARIPWVMVPSGGYTKKSYKLIARSLSYLLEKHGDIKAIKAKDTAYEFNLDH